MSALEAVIINAEGKEIDWFDPVEADEVRETPTHWHITVVYNEYEVEKLPGHKLVIRVKERQDLPQENLGGIRLPKVDRVEDRSALHRGDIDWRVGGITYVTRDHRTGEVTTVGANGSQELANLLACLLSAAGELQEKDARDE